MPKERGDLPGTEVKGRLVPIPEAWDRLTQKRKSRTGFQCRPRK